MGKLSDLYGQLAAQPSSSPDNPYIELTTPQVPEPGAPAPAPQAEDDRSVLSDAWGSFAMGANAMVKGAGWLFNSDEMQRIGQDGIEYWERTLSDVQREANQKRFINDDMSVGDAVFDPNSWMGVVAQSGAMMVPGLGAAGAMGRLGTALGMSQKASSALAGGAASATEGAVMAAMMGDEVKETILNAPPEQYRTSPYFQELVRAGKTEAEALETLAEKMAQAAAAPVGVWGAVLGWGFNRFVGEAVTGRLSNRVMKEGGKGAALEAGTELAQTGMEEGVRQSTLHDAINQPYDVPGALNNMVAGTGAGGITGGLIGMAGGLAGQREPQTPTDAALAARRRAAAAGGDALDQTNAASEALRESMARSEPQVQFDGSLAPLGPLFRAAQESPFSPDQPLAGREPWPTIGVLNPSQTTDDGEPLRPEAGVTPSEPEAGTPVPPVAPLETPNDDDDDDGSGGTPVPTATPVEKIKTDPAEARRKTLDHASKTLADPDTKAKDIKAVAQALGQPQTKKGERKDDTRARLQTTLQLIESLGQTTEQELIDNNKADDLKALMKSVGLKPGQKNKPSMAAALVAYSTNIGTDQAKQVDDAFLSDGLMAKQENNEPILLSDLVALNKSAKSTTGAVYTRGDVMVSTALGLDAVPPPAARGENAAAFDAAELLLDDPETALTNAKLAGTDELATLIEQARTIDTVWSGASAAMAALRPHLDALKLPTAIGTNIARSVWEDAHSGKLDHLVTPAQIEAARTQREQVERTQALTPPENWRTSHFAAVAYAGKLNEASLIDRERFWEAKRKNDDHGLRTLIAEYLGEPAPDKDDDGPVLQNRDRTAHAYVDQMDQIAAAPDYDRVSASKTATDGAPLVFADNGGFTIADVRKKEAPHSIIGRLETVTMSDGQGGTRKLKTVYAAVEASLLEASHSADGKENPKYGKTELTALNNGRTAGLKEAYRRGTADAYRQALLDDARTLGLDRKHLERMKEPVLVRFFNKHNLDGIADPGAASNESTGADLSPVEQARTDARRIDIDLLTELTPGDPTGPDNAEFVRRAVEALAGGKSNTALRDPNTGTLTQTGRSRIRAALIERAYTDPSLTEELVQATEGDLKTLGDILASVAGRWALMREQAKDEAINPDMDVTAALLSAVNMIRKARQEGRNLSDLAAQVDAFAGPADTVAVHLLHLFYRGKNLNQFRAKQTILTALNGYIDGAMQTAPGPDMFGDTSRPSDLLERERGLPDTESEPQTPEEEADAPGLSSDGADHREGGPSGQRPERGEGGPEDETGGRRAVASTAPEHQTVGLDNRELEQVVDEFNNAHDSMFEDEGQVHHLFDPPAKQEVVRLNSKVKVYHKKHGWMTPKEAAAKIDEWEAHVLDQSKTHGLENNQRVVLSLFDLTGKWSQPWEQAGYEVYRFDIQDDADMGDINNFSVEFFGDWFGDFEGKDVYAILAACPCTDFASSGARHFAAKDKDGRTVASVNLVHQTLAAIEYFRPAIWAIENPVGRIEKLGGLPPWRLSFDPNHLGETYTKKTLLWGRFNADLPIAPVEPTEGSKMHSQYGGKSQATKNARSATPEGFAYSFFMANNAVDHPVMAVANKYDRLDRKVIADAIAAGLSEQMISAAVDDPYYIELDDEAAEQALRQAMKLDAELKKIGTSLGAGRAKYGGEFGLDGKWYASGAALPPSALELPNEPDIGDADYAADKKAITPDTYGYPPEGLESVYDAIRYHASQGKDGQFVLRKRPLADVNEVGYGPGLARILSLIDLYNRGARFYDQQSYWDADRSEFDNDTLLERSEGEQSSAPADDFSLSPQTEAELAEQARARQDAERAEAQRQREQDQRERADAERDDFVLSGSNSPVDRAEARGQDNLFDVMGRPAEPAITRADVATAENLAKEQVVAQMEKFQFPELKKRIINVLDPLGLPIPRSKKRLMEAATDFTQVNPLAVAQVLGVTLPESITKVLTADFEGRVGEAVDGIFRDDGPSVQEDSGQYADGVDAALAPWQMGAAERTAVLDYLRQRPDADAVLARLDRLHDTPWAKQTVLGILARQAIRDLVAGVEPNYENPLTRGEGHALAQALRKRGVEGGFDYLSATGVLGTTQKAVNAVNGSFIDCNPSRACATYCYATKGRYSFTNSIVKSELVTWAVETDPARTGKMLANQYKARPEFELKKALRLFDKGDLSSAWLPMISELNQRGIRVQIFSKNPNVLRQVDSMNLRMLSIDESNLAMAAAHPDLPVAVVFDGSQSMADWILDHVDRLAVVLPIKIGQRHLTKAELAPLHKNLKARIRLCPIDSGIKSLGEHNCTNCDVRGGVGCFHKSVTRSVLAKVLTGVDSETQVANLIEELTNEAQHLEDSERADLLRSLDALVSKIRTGADPLATVETPQATAGAGDRAGSGTGATGRGRGDSDTPGVEARKARYRANPDQMELFTDLDALAKTTERDPYDRLEVRPDTTDTQRQEGRSALRDFFRQLNARYRRRGQVGANDGGGISLLGAAILKNFHQGRPNQLVGQTVRTPQDLAALAQVYRDPRFETFRVVLTQNGKVLEEMALSSRLPAAVKFTTDLYDKINTAMKRTGADGYWLMHNHPSGHSVPSRADVSLTQGMAQMAPGFQGHVVIDHNEYSTVAADGRTDTIQAPELNNTNFWTADPTQPHDLLGELITSPEAAVKLAKRVQEPGRFVFVTTSSKLEVTSLTSLPEALGDTLLMRPSTEGLATLRRLAVLTGSGGKGFVVLPPGQSLSRYSALLADGVVTDVVSAEGESLRDQGAYAAPHNIIERAELKRAEAGQSQAMRQLGERDTGYDVTETPAFRRWFGNSQVVDAQGKPRVVYHGTPDGRFLSEDGTFKSERGRFGMGRSEGIYWFSKDRAVANTYADDRRAFDYQNAEPQVVAAYLKLENPLVVDGKGQKWRDAQARGKTSDVMEQARTDGHDGVIIRNVRDHYTNERSTPTDTYAVFESAQIKSATDNTGDFDPANDDIRFRRDGTDAANDGLSAPEAQTLADGFMAGWTGKPPVTVVDRISELPKGLRRKIREAQAEGDMRAVFWRGRVYVLAPRIPNADALQEVILHEVIGHYGLRTLLGDELKPLLNRVWLAYAGKPQTQALIGKYFPKGGFDPKLAKHRLMIAEELLAHMAESGQHQKLWTRIMAAIRNGLRALGVTLKLNDTDLLNLLRGAQKVVEQGGFSKPSDADTYFRRAFHGTPHRFDRFSLAAMGTGEGAQAFGWGLYFAGNRKVAEHYRDALSLANDNTFVVDGQEETPEDGSVRLSALAEVVLAGSPEQALANTKKIVERIEHWGDPVDPETRALIEELESLQGSTVSELSGRGHLYEVEIPDDEDYLDHDLPLDRQPRAIRELVEGKILGKTVDELKTSIEADNARLLRRLGLLPKYALSNGREVYRELSKTLGGDRAASEFLGSIGIPGLRYLDGSSRHKTFRQLRDEFLEVLDEDATIDEVTDLFHTDHFSPQHEAILQGLADSDWLGFDVPAQAISAALSNDLYNYDDVAKSLWDAIEAARADGYHNYVIWDESVVSVQAVNDEQAQADALLSRTGTAPRPDSLDDDLADRWRSNMEGWYGGDQQALLDGARSDMRAAGRNPDTDTDEQIIEAMQSAWAAKRDTELKRWLGDSVVVDDQGQPKRVYHRTSQSFDTFKVDDEGASGPGLFFGENPEHLPQAHNRKRDGDNIMPVYLRMESPLYVDEFNREEMQQRWANGDRQFPLLLTPEIVARLKRAGYDGIINEDMYGDGDPNEYVVFNPGQVKSAIGNSGDFDGLTDDIRFSRTGSATALDTFDNPTDAERQVWGKINPPTRRESAKEWLDTKLENWRETLRQGMVDRYAALQRLDEARWGRDYAETHTTRSAHILAHMANAASGALSTMLAHGRVMLTEDKVLKLREGDTSGGLENVLRQLGSAGEVDRFFGWIAGNRAYELKKKKLENLFTDADIEVLRASNGGTTADGQDRAALYDTVYEQFKAYQNDVLEIADQAGLLRKGVEDEDQAVVMLAKRHKVAKTLRQKYQRLQKKIALEEDAEYLDDLHGRAGVVYELLYEEVATKVADFDTELYELMTDQRELWENEFYVPFYRVKPDGERYSGPSGLGSLSRQEAFKQLKGGTDPLKDLMSNTLMNMHHLLDAALKNQAAIQAINNAQYLGIAKEKPQKAIPANRRTFILRDGVRVYYDIDDPLVFQAVTALEKVGFDSAGMRVMRKFKRLFTELVTSTPQFLAANLGRDSMQAPATSPVSKNPIKNIVQGIRQYTDERHRANLLAMGAGFHFGHVYGENARDVRYHMERQLKGAKILTDRTMIPEFMRAGWEAWRSVTDVAENANRAAIYAQMKAQGQNDLLAAYQSRDLLNFSQHGAWPMVRFFIDTVPFLNARIQGLDKIYRSGVKPGLHLAFKTGGASDKQALARFWTVTGAIAVASILLYLHNRDDEDYEALEDWQKDTTWFLKAGDSAVLLPRPFEAGAIATVAERLVELMVDDTATGQQFAERLGFLFGQTFAFDARPQAFKPLMDVYANYDPFTERPIETMGMERLSPSLRSRGNSSSLAKVVSSASEGVFGPDSNYTLSPVQVDHLIGGYLGQVGLWASGLNDSAWRWAKDEDAPDKHWYEYQPLRRFYRNLSDEPSYTRYATEFYDALKTSNRVYADLREHLQQGDVEGAREVARANPGALGQRVVLNKLNQRLRKINQAIQQVYQDKDASGADKRAALDRLRAEKNELTRRIGAYLDRAG